MAKFPSTSHHSSGAGRLLEVDVEPLSEQRWAKIEQAVFTRLELPAEVGSASALRPAGAVRGFRWLPRAAAAVSVLAACLAVALYFLHDSGPTLSRIATGSAGSRVALPGIVLDVSPESAVVVSGNAAESRLVLLDRGEISCDVAHRRPGVPLIVQAGEVQVEVVGTRFSVTRTGDAARVAVQEGVVKVSARGVTTRLRAGENWPPALASAAEPAARPSAAATAPPSNAPLSTPSAQAPSEPEALSEPRVVERRTTRPRPRLSERKSAQKAAPEVSAPEAPELPAPEAPTVPDVQSQFETAAQLEAKNPARAIQIYEGMEHGSSSWAKNALFAHGRLEAARGNRAEARRILGQYLVGSPQGPNAPDARLLLQRLE